MPIILKVTPYVAEKILRDDIVKELGRDGIEAIIDWYDSIDDGIPFDQSDFYVWSRYKNIQAALSDYDENYLNDLKKTFEDDEDSLNEECCTYFEDQTNVLYLTPDGGAGEVLINTDF